MPALPTVIVPQEGNDFRYILAMFLKIRLGCTILISLFIFSESEVARSVVLDG